MANRIAFEHFPKAGMPETLWRVKMLRLVDGSFIEIVRYYDTDSAIEKLGQLDPKFVKVTEVTKYNRDR